MGLVAKVTRHWRGMNIVSFWAFPGVFASSSSETARISPFAG
jgi:hypothetical protein